MPLKPATSTQVQKAALALQYLRDAAHCLRYADCPRTLARVNAAIKSAGGALRHLERRVATGQGPVPTPRKVWEVTAAGFDAADSTTDDRVLWVRADSREQVAECVKDTGATVHDEVPVDLPGLRDCLDYELPQQALNLQQELLRFASEARNANRAVPTDGYLLP